jgi:hypothetical protein
MSYVFRGRKAGRVESLNDYKAFGDDVDFTVDQEAANVVTSCEDDSSPWAAPDIHLPVLDLDFPIVAEPSTTEGHFHLYIDRAMTWDQLVKLMDVMEEVGLLETGYVEAAKIRSYSSVRLPGVKKPPRGAAA